MRQILEGKKEIHGLVSPVKYTKEKMKALFECPHDMTSQRLKILCVFTDEHSINSFDWTSTINTVIIVDAYHEVRKVCF